MVRDMGSHPGSQRLCHVLVEDSDLAEVVPPDRRDRAVDACTAPLLTLPTGPWIEEMALPPDALGLLVLEGLMLRRVAIDGRFAVELVGAGLVGEDIRHYASARQLRNDIRAIAHQSDRE